LEDLKAGRTGELPSNEPRYAFVPKEFLEAMASRIGAAVAEGMIDPREGTELSEVLPEVEVLGVEEFFKRCLMSGGSSEVVDVAAAAA
jgi:hypothetical protein